MAQSRSAAAAVAQSSTCRCGNTIGLTLIPDSGRLVFSCVLCATVVLIRNFLVSGHELAELNSV